MKQLLLDKDKDKEGENGSIGTVATRPIIIDKLVERGYFSEQGKKLVSTPLGRELYRILPDELKKPDMTAYWWAIQEDIRQGKRPWTALTDSVLEMVRHVVSTSYPAIDMELIPEQYRRYAYGPARPSAPQHILAPAGMASSRITRFSRSSPPALWTAEISIPQLSRPIILRGGRLTMANRVLPTRSSGS